MKVPGIVQNDPWLNPYQNTIVKRLITAEKKREALIQKKSLFDFANGHLTFGCFNINNSIVFRDWLPNAQKVYLIGAFSDWAERDDFLMQPMGNGVWEYQAKGTTIQHGDLYKLKVYWDGGSGERIPAWSRRVVQDNNTKIFSAQVWLPKSEYIWTFNKKLPKVAPLIYEVHIGMAIENEGVATFVEFKNLILPRIIQLGYNTIQLMAVQEHPYYGSFGYHVSSFFAVSSRFGTPEELKELIDAAHNAGIRVIMDIVHSHAVKNEIEGLGNYDGTRHQFFHIGDRGMHPAWDSYCFNYGKNEVLHFLLSNIKYWLDEFRFDGFRFDGVTSMLYLDHGLGRDFVSYENYFDGGQDEDAITYLILANQLMKEINPNSISIAEEMSGYPGLASQINAGGLGFDFRLAMGIPDFWIKTIKERRDEEWDMGQIFHELTSKRIDELTISYAESHDQALVGDKTLAFRLMNDAMYFHMHKDDQNAIIDRGMALHKMIRLITIGLAGGGYLNFMGNEFGHPEWIDFPREGNNWSYKHAKRQWSLADRDDLKYCYLNNFDHKMIDFVKRTRLINFFPITLQHCHQGDQVLAFSRSNLVFIFNFNPNSSFTGYGIKVLKGKYRYLFSTDSLEFGGNERFDESQVFNSIAIDNTTGDNQILVYLPARSALVLEKFSGPKLLQSNKRCI